jgi:hypothetical protein
VKIPLPQIPTGAWRASKVVYLNREGATLVRGTDEASKNRTSLVPEGRTSATVPAFTGSYGTWTSFVKCVRSKFARYDVEVVDRRPVDSGYLMVVVGGSTKDLGRTDAKHATGLAPFNGQPIPNAVVAVFSGALRNRPTSMCETAGMEIGHAYGLDHSRHCSDLMTYMKRCGSRTFVDKDLRCGEHTARDCPKGEKTQNSHRHLLEVLGPHAE